MTNQDRALRDASHNLQNNIKRTIQHCAHLALLSAGDESEIGREFWRACADVRTILMAADDTVRQLRILHAKDRQARCSGGDHAA